MNQLVDHKTLLIGSSLLRNIDERKFHSTEVRCLYGAQVRDIAVELEALADSEARYARIILLTGGNDAAVSVETSVNSLTAAITAAKRMSKDVAVSEIPPRRNPQHPIDNTSILNKEFCTLSKDLSVPFLPNHSYFFLSSNEINQDYYYDDVHLTFKGTGELIKSLGLTSDDDSSACCSLQPTQTLPMTRPCPMPRRRTQKHPCRSPSRLAGSHGQMTPETPISGRSLSTTSLAERHEQIVPGPPTYGRSVSTSALAGSLEQIALTPAKTIDTKMSETQKLLPNEETITVCELLSTYFCKCCRRGSPNKLWYEHMIAQLGLYSLRRRRLIGIGIPIINPRRSSDRLRFIMGIPIPVRRRLFSE